MKLIGGFRIAENAEEELSGSSDAFVFAEGIGGDAGDGAAQDASASPPLVSDIASLGQFLDRSVAVDGDTLVSFALPGRAALLIGVDACDTFADDFLF